MPAPNAHHAVIASLRALHVALEQLARSRYSSARHVASHVRCAVATLGDVLLVLDRHAPQRHDIACLQDELGSLLSKPGDEINPSRLTRKKVEYCAVALQKILRSLSSQQQPREDLDQDSVGIHTAALTSSVTHAVQEQVRNSLVEHASKVTDEHAAIQAQLQRICDKIDDKPKTPQQQRLPRGKNAQTQTQTVAAAQRQTQTLETIQARVPSPPTKQDQHHLTLHGALVYVQQVQCQVRSFAARNKARPLAVRQFQRMINELYVLAQERLNEHIASVCTLLGIDRSLGADAVLAVEQQTRLALRLMNAQTRVCAIDTVLQRSPLNPDRVLAAMGSDVIHIPGDAAVFATDTYTAMVKLLLFEGVRLEPSAHDLFPTVVQAISASEKQALLKSIPLPPSARRSE
ncbi:hypothetical protein RI367_004230 [Sorochytrium milnesiophthora]